MNLIAAVDKNWAIGYKNQLLVRIPEDQKWFRESTTGKVVIMGRKTLESFPNGRPLKNRTNIVITSDMNYQVNDAIVVHSSNGSGNVRAMTCVVCTGCRDITSVRSKIVTMAVAIETVTVIVII